MAVVRKFKGLNLNCGHWDPQKAHLSQNDVFWRIFGKNPFKAIGYSELQEPKKALKNYLLQMVRKITQYGEQNLWRERDKI